MRSKFLILSSVVLLLGFVSLSVVDPVQALQTRYGCGKVEASYPEGEGGAGLRIDKTVGVSCRRARKLARSCIRHERVSGWRGYVTFQSDYGPGKSWMSARGGLYIEMQGIAGGKARCLREVDT